MDTRSEEPARDALSCTYTAKSVAPYLTIDLPCVPLGRSDAVRNRAREEAVFYISEMISDAYLFFIDQKRLEKKKRYRQTARETERRTMQAKELEETALEEIFVRSGITTQEQKDAYTIIGDARIALVRRITRPDRRGAVAVTDGDDEAVREILLSSRLFDSYLRMSIEGGVRVLSGRYQAAFNCIPLPPIVNPDFAPRAGAWLEREVRARIGEGRSCALLESIIVSEEKDGRVRMRLWKTGGHNINIV